MPMPAPPANDPSKTRHAALSSWARLLALGARRLASTLSPAHIGRMASLRVNMASAVDEGDTERFELCLDALSRAAGESGQRPKAPLALERALLKQLQTREPQGSSPLDPGSFLERLLVAGFDPNPPKARGDSLIHRCARANRPALLSRLIRAGADAETLNDYGQTPLQAALAYGSEACALLLIQAGASLSAIDSAGRSPLATAMELWLASSGDREAAGERLAWALLQAGADPNLGSSRGLPPLLMALDGDRLGFANELLDRGARGSAVLLRRLNGSPWMEARAGRALAPAAIFERCHADQERESLSGHIEAPADPFAPPPPPARKPARSL